MLIQFDDAKKTFPSRLGLVVTLNKINPAGTWAWPSLAKSPLPPEHLKYELKIIRLYMDTSNNQGVCMI